MGGKFKFQVQDSDLEYLSWRFDKHIALSEKKLPLGSEGMAAFDASILDHLWLFGWLVGWLVCKQPRKQ